MALLAGTSSVTGEGFFRNFVEHLARAYGAQFALVTELLPGTPGTARTLAFYAHNNHMENFQYSLQGTPCACVYENGLSYFKADLQKLFPGDSDLVDMGVNSYLGMPLYGQDGDKIGHICVLGTNPVGEAVFSKEYLKIFSARAAAELERIYAERQLVHQRTELSNTRIAYRKGVRRTGQSRQNRISRPDEP